MPYSIPSSLRFLLGALSLSGVLLAQGRDRFESPSEGYRIYVSKAIKAVPTEPNERQTLAKWGATLEFKDKLFHHLIYF